MSTNSSGFIVSATPPKTPEFHAEAPVQVPPPASAGGPAPVPAPFSTTSGLPLPTQPLNPEAIQLLQRLRAFRGEMNQSIDTQLRQISESRSHAMARLTAMRQTVLQRTAPDQQIPQQQQQQQQNQQRGGGGGGEAWGRPSHQQQQNHHHHHHQQQQQQQQNTQQGHPEADWNIAASNNLSTPPITPSKHMPGSADKTDDGNPGSDPNDLSVSSTTMLGSPSQKGTVGLEAMLSAFAPAGGNGYSLFAPPPSSPNLDALLAGAAAASRPDGAGAQPQNQEQQQQQPSKSSPGRTHDSPPHEALLGSLLRDQDNEASIERYRERKAQQQQQQQHQKNPHDDAEILLPREQGNFQQQQQQTSRPLDFGGGGGGGGGGRGGGREGSGGRQQQGGGGGEREYFQGAGTSDESLRTVSVERLVKVYGHRTAEHRVLTAIQSGRPVVSIVPNTVPDTALSLGGIDVPETSLPCQTIVQFKNGRLLQVPFSYFVAPGQYVFVDVDRGTDLGLCVFTATSVHGQAGGKDKQLLAGLRNARLGKVVGVGSAQSRGMGVASEAEVQQWRQLGDMEQKAVISANRLALDHRVPLSFMDAEYQFDRSKLTIFYPRDTPKTDFRELVRAMYKSFRARIWLEAMPEGTTSSLAIAAASSGNGNSPGEKQQQQQ